MSIAATAPPASPPSRLWRARWHSRIGRTLGGLALTLLVFTAAADDDWQRDGVWRGVALEYHTADSGYRAYRGTVHVCTTLPGLQAFVADASRLKAWIPFTEEAYALPGSGHAILYYLRTSAPWPFKSRDMVYRLVQRPADGSRTLLIDLQGVPDAVPEQSDAVRLKAADGRWMLTLEGGVIGVTLVLAIDPRPAPAFLANRRLAATVGGMLANLAAQFPCIDPGRP